MRKDKSLYQVFDEKQINDFPLAEYVYVKTRQVKGHKMPPEGTRVDQYDEFYPGMVSPVCGEISEQIMIPVDGKDTEVVKIIAQEEAKGEPPVSESTGEEPGDQVFSQLRRSGYILEDEIGSGSDIIISAADADPMCAISQQILRDNQQVLKEKFELFKQFFKREKIYFVVAEHQFDLVWKLQTSGITTIKIPSYYPAALPEIVTDSLQRKYSLKTPLYISIEDFLNICRIVETGIPTLEKVVTVNDMRGTRNIRVKIGTPLRMILAESEVKDGCKVIAGGPMRGYAVYELETPVTWNINCVSVQYDNEIVRAVNNQCLNCGRCNDACPVSLSVNMITRYSEFSIFDKCSELGVDNCIECGLCSYYCPAGRSLLQLIRLAKSELKNSVQENEQ